MPRRTSSSSSAAPPPSPTSSGRTRRRWRTAASILDRLLAGSSFTLPLNAAGEEGSRPLTVWGSGDYRNFSGGGAQTLTYDGKMASASLGMDSSLRPELLAGMSVTRAQATVDYASSVGPTGELTAAFTSFNPYIGWQAPASINLWATAGHGWGEIEVDDQAGAAQSGDLTQQMVAAGVNGPLISGGRETGGGTAGLRFKAGTAFTWADVEGSETLEGATLSAGRLRLMFEGTLDQKLGSGAMLTNSLEAGLRRDDGDGETGSGFEAGGGMRLPTGCRD